MPQYARKTRQMVITAGVKPAIYAERYCTVAGSVVTVVSKLQYISKGAAGGWPGADWLTTLGPGHAMIEATKEEATEESKEKVKSELKHEAQHETHHTSGSHSGPHRNTGSVF